MSLNSLGVGSVFLLLLVCSILKHKKYMAFVVTNISYSKTSLILFVYSVLEVIVHALLLSCCFIFIE